MQLPAQFPPPGSRAVLFIRVSSEEQAKSDKDSLAEQERVLRAAADKFKWQVVDAIIIPGIRASFYSYEQPRATVSPRLHACSTTGDGAILTCSWCTCHHA